MPKRGSRAAPAGGEVMKIVPLNEVKNQFSQYLEEAQHEDIVVTKNGRAAAIIHAVTDEDLEDYLFETDPRFIARIEALRAQYRREGATPLREAWRPRARALIGRGHVLTPAPVPSRIAAFSFKKKTLVLRTRSPNHA